MILSFFGLDVEVYFYMPCTKKRKTGREVVFDTVTFMSDLVQTSYFWDNGLLSMIGQESCLLGKVQWPSPKWTGFWFSCRNDTYLLVVRMSLSIMDSFYKSHLANSCHFGWFLHEWTILCEWSCFSKGILKCDWKHEYSYQIILCQPNSTSAKRKLMLFWFRW